MRLGTIAFLLGIMAVQQCDQLPALHWYGLIPVLLILAWRMPALPRTVLIAAIGFLWAGLFASMNMEDQLPKRLEGQDLLLEGRVVSIPKQGERTLRFDYATNIEGRSYRIRLNWYNLHGRQPQANETWRLRVKLKRRYGFMNPGGFDYERLLFRQGVDATGYVRRDDSNEVLPETVTDFGGNIILAMRNYVSSRLGEQLGDHSRRGLIEALAIGHRTYISNAEWDILTRTGTNHLVAISGLHIGLIAGLVYVLMQFIFSRSVWIVTRCPAQVLAAVCALLAAIIYSALAGFAIPTQRALIMVGVFMLAIIMRHETTVSRVLMTALLGILLIDPLAVVDYGFWLSFGAVAIIAFTLSGRLGIGKKLFHLGKIQLVIAIGMLPLMLVFFQQASLVAPLANMIAVPWISLVTVPVTLVGTITLDGLPFLSELAFTVSSWSLDMLVAVLNGLSQMEMATYETHSPHAWTLLPAMAGIAWLLMPRGTPSRWLGICFLLPMLLIARQGPERGVVNIILLDVGQGLSVFVRTQHHSLVYDTGPRFSDSFNTGKAVIVPVLKHEDIKLLDTLIVGHGDNDHSGGADSVLSGIQVDTVLTGAQKGRWHHERAEACHAGQRWRWDGVLFEILSPHDDERRGGNNNSCVLRISTPDQALLIPGDIEHATEQKLVNKYAARLKSDVLIAPHHGSKTSSSQDFLDAISPAVILIPNGYRNRFGFPHPDVTRRYDEKGISWYETATEGAISLVMGKSGLPEPISWRNKAKRYWHTQ